MTSAWAPQRKAWAPQRQMVRDELKRQGISQGELARRIGASEKHLSQMLTGAADGRLELWVRIAAELDLEWHLRPSLESLRRPAHANRNRG